MSATTKRSELIRRAREALDTYLDGQVPSDEAPAKVEFYQTQPVITALEHLLEDLEGESNDTADHAG